jgi:hypothetical protein
MATPPGARSGVVTALAIVNFIFGALGLLCGGAIVCGGGAIAGIIGAAAKNDPTIKAEDAAAVAGIAGGAVAVMGVIVMVMGVPTIVAGIGVLKRRQWGRILTLVLGALAGALAVFALVSLNIVGLLIHGGYCAFAYIVLLNKQYAAEFQ